MVTARHRIRCYPNAEQRAQLDIEFEAARVVYNLCIEMARHAHANGQPYPGEAGFKKAITIWKKASDWPSATAASVQCLQHAAIHADLAFKHFFRRVKAGETPGFPRFKKRGQTEAAATYNIVHIGWQPETGAVRLSKTRSNLRCNWDRRGMPQQAKSLTISRDAAGRYYASFTCQIEPKSAPSSASAIGLDVGVAHALSDSNGAHIDLPQFLSPGRQRRMLHLQRKLARQQFGSNARQRTRQAIARLHARIADSRRAWHDRTSRQLVDQHALIAIEDLNLRGMTRAPAAKPDGQGGWLRNNARAKAKLARAMLNVGAGELRRMLEYKGQWAGRDIIAVNPAYTSQTCAACGHVSPDNRRTQAQFLCTACAHSDHADTNAARNILARALAGSPPAVGAARAELMRAEGLQSASSKPELALEGRTNRYDRHHAKTPVKPTG